jgi:flagellar biosynthesis protein FliP
MRHRVFPQAVAWLLGFLFVALSIASTAHAQDASPAAKPPADASSIDEASTGRTEAPLPSLPSGEKEIEALARGMQADVIDTEPAPAPAARTTTTAAPGAPVRAWPPSGDMPAPAQTDTAQALRIVLGLTVLAVLPALLVCITSFLRTIIVLSMLRHAIGMPETPPNPALIGLALFLTAFTMSPVLQQVNQDAFRPFMAGKISMDAAYEKGVDPLREFMVRQTREQDLGLMVELSKAPVPSSMADISNVQLIPAFMLSELRAAFQIGFVIFLPFLLIDLIVSSILMALGMMMMPPTTIALPLKILMFVLIDGWSLVLKALVGSFH